MKRGKKMREKKKWGGKREKTEVCELEEAANKFTEWDRNMEEEKDQKEWIDKEEDITENDENRLTQIMRRRL